ncbi:PQQ-dependent sugar dehydrogenase [Dokdonella sp.]|uniref:PQQ-dependent sugar dehydrogenase n=1 Tax=Dokdonella sp. TaxID=2291710 RepID=UPI0037831E66
MQTCSRLALAIAAVIGAGGATSTMPPPTSIGPNPVLPEPQHALLPTVKVAKAIGWEGRQQPTAAPGFAVHAFAAGLTHPRWLYVLPNGDVLVAETDAPSDKPDDAKGIKGKVMKTMMKKAGSTTGSADRITLLRDADHDGSAETRHEFLSGLHSPFGMVLIGNAFYVADTDAVVRYGYKTGATAATGDGERVVDLPAGTINHHWTKNILASADGKSLYATVGSNSNIGENGMAAETGRAGIWRIDLAARTLTPFATGLRNPNGMALQPDSGALWTVVNERDELGDDLVPDYMTSVKEGAFYGWPYSYWGQHVDERVKPRDAARVASAIAPDYALGAHTASLGLAFCTDDAFGAHYRNGAFVGQHGSWNRAQPSGYQVVFVPFADGKPSGALEPVLTDFLDAEGNARGRPVGVAFDGHGGLLVADDVGGRIWRVTPAARQGLAK